MAEVLAVIGGVVACTQLAEKFVELSDKLKRYRKIIRDAPKQIDDLREDTCLFATGLESLAEGAKKAFEGHQQTRRVQRVTRNMDHIILQGKNIRKAIRMLLQDFNLSRAASSFKKLRTRLKWLRRQHHVQFLQVWLSKMKHDVSFLSTTFLIDALLNQIKSLEAQKLAVPTALLEDM